MSDLQMFTLKHQLNTAEAASVGVKGDPDYKLGRPISELCG
ncbi:MAG: hypothetical protein ABIE92_09410 [bacterium]